MTSSAKAHQDLIPENYKHTFGNCTEIVAFNMWLLQSCVTLTLFIFSTISLLQPLRFSKSKAISGSHKLLFYSLDPFSSIQDLCLTQYQASIQSSRQKIKSSVSKVINQSHILINLFTTKLTSLLVLIDKLSKLHILIFLYQFTSFSCDTASYQILLAASSYYLSHLFTKQVLGMILCPYFFLMIFPCFSHSLSFFFQFGFYLQKSYFFQLYVVFWLPVFSFYLWVLIINMFLDGNIFFSLYLFILHSEKFAIFQPIYHRKWVVKITLTYRIILALSIQVPRKLNLYQFGKKHRNNISNSHPSPMKKCHIDKQMDTFLEDFLSFSQREKTFNLFFKITSIHGKNYQDMFLAFFFLALHLNLSRISNYTLMQLIVYHFKFLKSTPMSTSEESLKIYCSPLISTDLICFIATGNPFNNHLNFQFSELNPSTEKINLLNYLQLTCRKSQEASVHSHCADCTVNFPKHIYICKHLGFGWQPGWSILHTKFRKLSRFVLKCSVVTYTTFLILSGLHILNKCTHIHPKSFPDIMRWKNTIQILDFPPCKILRGDFQDLNSEFFSLLLFRDKHTYNMNIKLQEHVKTL
ncbi:hypothetical protein VP01_1592g1 [Puccinia sorghi]|uniref:Uncharacterized protein n=1 Tax=Puccinia sorghi TaxID=27349 RepID=A0A0L6VHI5_9BASI|nr:hypothetical protein VP01_1592g1 [Puccinia sorghi]